MRKRIVVFLFAIVSTLQFSFAATPETAATQTIEIDAAAHATRLPHFWEHFFGSAARSSPCARVIVRICVRPRKSRMSDTFAFTLSFTTRSEFTTKMQQGNPVFNFSYVDQIYDGLLDKVYGRSSN